MTKVEIGELDKLLVARPEIAATLALGKRIILNGRSNLGDYASIIVFGTEEMSNEILINKAELRRFAEEVLEKIK